MHGPGASLFRVKWRATNSGYRTLLRHTTDSCTLVTDDATDLGVYSNRDNGTFVDSGFDITPDSWTFLAVTGEAASPRSHAGQSRFYIGVVGTTGGRVTDAGTANRVCSGEQFYRIGWPGQGPGKVAYIAAYRELLPREAIQAIFVETRSSYPGFDGTSLLPGLFGGYLDRSGEFIRTS